MTSILDPFDVRGVRFPRRVWMSPMCQYSATTDGMPTDWHAPHLGARALGGAGMVMLEATAVTPNGRISPFDLGIWSDAHIEPLAGLVRVIHRFGAVAGIQIAHAGAKASVKPPWEARGEAVEVADGGWQPVAESPRPHREVRVIESDEVGDIVAAFAAAAARAVAAGFDVIEIHGAHGYLVHSFLSPATNSRTDEWGAPHRDRFALAVVDAVRAQLPDATPLLYRVSATDWLEGSTTVGLTIDDTAVLAAELATRGVDMIDVSSGGLLPGIRVASYPGYQVGFASEIRRRVGIPVAAVGKIVGAAQAEQIVGSGHADAVFLGRALLRESDLVRRMAAELGRPLPQPPQYAWAIEPRGEV